MTAMKVLYDTPAVTSKCCQARIEIYYYCRKNDKIIDSIVTQNVSLTNIHTHRNIFSRLRVAIFDYDRFQLQFEMQFISFINIYGCESFSSASNAMDK